MKLAFFSLLMMKLAAADQGLISREVHLKANADVSSQIICLNDLVEEQWLRGRCAVDKKACCLWTLNGDHQGTLEKRDIEKEVPQQRIGNFEFKFVGADKVVVTQTHRELSTTEIGNKLTAAVAAKLGKDARAVTIESLRAFQPMFIRLEDENAWDVMLPENFSQNASVKIVSTSSEKLQVLGWVQASLRFETEVYVAKKAITPLQPIDIENFEIKKTTLSWAMFSDANLIKKEAFPIGSRARVTISSGAPLLGSAIERVPLVKLGDGVTLILRSDNLRISTKGVAQGSAGIGDMVTVQLPRYNRTFRGRLVEGKLVEVWL